MRILLVDDNALFLASAQRFLASMEAVAVTTARDGFEAIEHLGRERPDLVLLDLNMPGMNGLETTRRMKALEPALRVVVVSLWDAPEFRTAAALAGAEGFVAKQEFTARIPPLLGAADSGAARPAPESRSACRRGGRSD